MKTTDDALTAALSMRASIGGLRDGNARKLDQETVNRFLLARLASLEDDVFRMMGGLQALGADCCETCSQWTKDFIQVGDFVQCMKCFNPEWFIDEDGNGQREAALLDLLVKSGRRHLLPHRDSTTRKPCKADAPNAVLIEPWLSLYQNGGYGK